MRGGADLESVEAEWAAITPSKIGSSNALRVARSAALLASASRRTLSVSFDVPGEPPFQKTNGGVPAAGEWSKPPVAAGATHCEWPDAV
jgi:hypothetical protein